MDKENDEEYEVGVRQEERRQGDDVTEETVVGVYGHVAARCDGSFDARPGQQHHQQQRPRHVAEDDADREGTNDVDSAPHLDEAADEAAV